MDTCLQENHIYPGISDEPNFYPKLANVYTSARKKLIIKNFFLRTNTITKWSVSDRKYCLVFLLNYYVHSNE